MTSFEKIRETFKDLLDCKQLLNFTILTEDGGKFEIHIELVAAGSPYLKKNCVQDSVLVPGISKSIMANIIEFTYTGKISFGEVDIEKLIAAADFLQMYHITKAAMGWLVDNVSVDNCVRMFIDGKRYQNMVLKEKAKLFILENFEKVYTSKDFDDMEVNDVVSILSDDKLNVKCEETVYSAVQKYLNGSPDDREKYLPDLLRCVRIGFLSNEFFMTNFIENEKVCNNADCRSFLLLGKEMFKSYENNNATRVLDLHCPFLRPRVPLHVIFATGGWSNGSATNIMETYDYKSDRWFFSFNEDTFPRAYHGMVWHQGKIFLIGGFDGSDCFNSVRVFDPVTRDWEHSACMHTRRCYVSVAVVDNCIYAMGGFDGHRRNRSCERYNPQTNQWSLIANMSSVRSDASAAVVDGKIYIAGGFNGAQVLDSAECYDPATDTWTLIPNMMSPRSGLKAVELGGSLYAIGGFNGNARLSTVEKYDLRTRTWSSVASMSGPRSNFAAVAINEGIYVLGGFNGFATITSMERYDPGTNTWTSASDLNVNRSAVAACVVSKFPAASEYSYIGIQSN